MVFELKMCLKGLMYRFQKLHNSSIIPILQIQISYCWVQALYTAKLHQNKNVFDKKNFNTRDLNFGPLKLESFDLLLDQADKT